MKHNSNPVFPEGFLWGASSAAWQCEGATLEGGRTQAIIDLNSQTKKPYTDNSVYQLSFFPILVQDYSGGGQESESGGHRLL